MEHAKPEPSRELLNPLMRELFISDLGNMFAVQASKDDVLPKEGKEAAIAFLTTVLSEQLPSEEVPGEVNKMIEEALEKAGLTSLGD